MESKLTWLKPNLEIIKIFIKAAIFRSWNDWRERLFVWYWLAFNLYYFFNRSIFISKCLHIYTYVHCLLMLFVCYLFSKYPLQFVSIGARSHSIIAIILVCRQWREKIPRPRSSTYPRLKVDPIIEFWKKQLNTVLNIIIDNLHYILLFLEGFFTEFIIKTL